MKNNTAVSESAKARLYAFLLLKFRMRSQKEICQRLKMKRFSPQAIKDTLDFLQAKGFIDDEAFAKAWFESRLSRLEGSNRIKAELRLKGVAKEIIDRAAETLRDSFPESEITLKLARDKFQRSKNIAPDIAKRRIYAYLLRRGFSPDAVNNAIEQLE